MDLDDLGLPFEKPLILIKEEFPKIWLMIQ